MPYAKRYRRKRNYKRGNSSLAKKAYVLAKKAYKMPELKYATITGTLTAPTTTGTMQCISLVSQGNTNNTRIGDTIHPTSVNLRMKMNLNASATASQVRVIVFRWISESPNTGSVTDILGSSTITSYKADDTRYQSEFLMDRVFSLNTDRPEIYLQRKIKLNKYMSFAEASATPIRNGVYIAILSDEATNAPALDYQTRLFYRDP